MVTRSVQVDGRSHELEVSLGPSEGWDGSVTIEADPYPLIVEEAYVRPAMRVGQSVAGGERRLPDLVARRMVRSGAGWAPEDSSGALRVVVPPEWRDVGTLRLRVRVFKLTDATLWKQVTTAYRNLLDYNGLAEAERRTAPFQRANAADSAFTRLDWARAGLFVPGER